MKSGMMQIVVLVLATGCGQSESSGAARQPATGQPTAGQATAGPANSGGTSNGSTSPEAGDTSLVATVSQGGLATGGALGGSAGTMPNLGGNVGLSGHGGTQATLEDGGSAPFAGTWRSATGGESSTGTTTLAIIGGTSSGGVVGSAAAGNTTGGVAAPGGGSAGNTSGQGGRTGSYDYCSFMPKFTGTQLMDGLGDEFSGIAPMTFPLSAARYVNPGRSGALPEVVTLRAAWSDTALHVHVHVDDPAIVVDSSATLWNGDNVQLFVAPTDNLTGTYTGTDDGGAIHVLITAPDPAGASRATVIYQNGVSTNSPFVTGLYAGRRVTGGYEIEAQLQWLPVANPLQSGARIGFDFMVGAAASSSQGLALEGGLANNPVPTSSPACDLGGRVQPGCDDRTWCQPQLL